MTLAQIVERLERIERMYPGWAQCPDCDEDVPVRDSAQPDAIAELKRDIEMALIKAGQL